MPHLKLPEFGIFFIDEKPILVEVGNLDHILMQSCRLVLVQTLRGRRQLITCWEYQNDLLSTQFLLDIHGNK